MGRPIAANGSRAGAMLIEGRFREGDNLQFLRELTQNGIEAGATLIQFGIHWTGVLRGDKDWGGLPGNKRLHRNRYRLVYYDNGKGMGSGMGDYMSGLLDLDSKGQSGGAHDNFGMGVRVALLPWNRAGVIVASWSHEKPEGQLMWLHFNPAAGQYEAISLEWDEDGEPRIDEVVPADVFPEFIDDRPAWLGPQADGSVGTGTMFLLLGNTGQEHTFLGPEGNWNNYTGLVALSFRYWDHRANLEIRYEDPGTANPDDWASRSRDRLDGTTLDQSTPNRSKRVYNSPVYPRRRAIAKPFETATIALPDGGTMTVFLSKKAPPQFTGVNTANRPGIFVRYRNELYHRRAAPADYRRFGVSYPAVYRCLWVIIEPRVLGADMTDGEEINDPFGGIFPSGSRTVLQYLPPLDPQTGNRPAGRELPWSTWAELFNRHMPDFVDKALIAAMGKQDDVEIDPEIVAQVAAPFVDRFKQLQWFTDTKGKVAGTPETERVGTAVCVGPSKGGGGGGESRRRQRVRPAGQADEQDVNAGAVTPAAAALPECRIDPQPFDDLRGEHPQPGALWQKGSGVGPGIVFLDPQHPVLAEVFIHWRRRYSDHDTPKVDSAVTTVYRTAMACRVGQILRYGQVQKLSDHALGETLLSNDALTAALFGLASEDAAIKQRTSGLRRLQ